MANKSFYISLPPPQASGTKPRRPPLTPSTVSPPCISAHTSSAAPGAGGPPRATALLARVASHPSTPRRGTPASSPLPSPSLGSPEHPYSPIVASHASTTAHSWPQRQQDGYISFPDFEKFCQSRQDGEDRDEQAKISSAKT